MTHVRLNVYDLLEFNKVRFHEIWDFKPEKVAPQLTRPATVCSIHTASGSASFTLGWRCTDESTRMGVMSSGPLSKRNNRQKARPHNLCMR